MIFDGYALERADHLLWAEQWQRLADDPSYSAAQREQFTQRAAHERQIAGLLARYERTMQRLTAPPTHEER